MKRSCCDVVLMGSMRGMGAVAMHGHTVLQNMQRQGWNAIIHSLGLSTWPSVDEVLSGS